MPFKPLSKGTAGTLNIQNAEIAVLGHQVSGVEIPMREDRLLLRQGLAKEKKMAAYFGSLPVVQMGLSQAFHIMLHHEVQFPHQFFYIEMKMEGRAIGGYIFCGAVMKLGKQIHRLTIIAFLVLRMIPNPGTR